MFFLGHIDCLDVHVLALWVKLFDQPEEKQTGIGKVKCAPKSQQATSRGKNGQLLKAGMGGVHEASMQYSDNSNGSSQVRVS